MTTTARAPRRHMLTTVVTEKPPLSPTDHAEAVRQSFRSGITRPLAWRKAQLKALDAFLADNVGEIQEAVGVDLGKPGTETLVTEVSAVRAEIKHALRHLSGWAAPRRASLSAMLLPGSAALVREPLGTVLIIAPWNYPVNLLLAPLVGALAAGDAVVLKPSELAPHTSAIIARLLPHYLDRRAVRVVEGGVEETTALLTFDWDHIFYTGNGTVGRIVAEAAATHLTPITLELGGKSPAYVDDSADIDAVAAWLAWGKFLNAGQTCVAPDYVLASPHVAEQLVPALRGAIAKLFGADPRTSADYGRMVNNRHLHRVLGLIEGQQVAIGGDADPADRYIAPTVLTDVSLDSPVMAEEIFGPVLPIVHVADEKEAIGIINDRDKPLALYVFSASTATQDSFRDQTSSGSLVANAVILQLSAQSLPFGGVGASGMGSYHGEFGMATFSHDKPVLRKASRTPGRLLSLGLPPYTAMKKRLMGG